MLIFLKLLIVKCFFSKIEVVKKGLDNAKIKKSQNNVTIMDMTK